MLRHYTEVNARAGEARSAAEQARTAAQAAHNELRGVDQNIQQIQQSQQNELAKFHKNMPALVAHLEARAHEFKRPPVGPIGKYVKLKDQRWARPIEVGPGASSTPGGAS